MRTTILQCLSMMIGAALTPLIMNGETFAENQITSTIEVSNRDQLIQAVRNAKPGTKISVAPGTYQGGLHFAGLRGEANKPIVIAARDAKKPPVFKGGNSGVHLSRPRYVQLHDLVLIGASGNGLNIDDGGTADNPATHIVLRNLQISDVGPKGNQDGIKLSGVDEFKIEKCQIERWGTGGSAIDMVGCHQGQIAGCLFKYRGDLFANGVQTKGGSANITIKHCRFENAGGRAVNLGGSTGENYFRPKSAKYEAKDITVEDCTFIGSMAPIVFVGVDGAKVRYNTIYRPTRWVIRILQQSQGPRFVPCRNGQFTNNIIVFQSNEVRTFVNVGGGTEPKTFKFAKNHWYCADSPSRSRPALPIGEIGGTYGKDPRFVNKNAKDLRLSKTSPVRNAGVRATD